MKFCVNLKEHAKELPLTKKEEKSYKKQKFCRIKHSLKSLMKYCKVAITVITQGNIGGPAHSICNLR